MAYTASSVLSKMIKPKDSVIKLRKLKQIRRKNLEKNFLDIQLKGQDHYVFIKENGKAQVVFKDGQWIAEHISCLLYTSPSPRDRTRSRMPSSA